MRKGPLLGVGLLAVASWLAMPAADAAETHLTATMTGAEEVPGPGDDDGKGTATIVIDDAANTVCYEFTYEGIDQPTMAHIHTGAKGVSGPPAVNFDVAKNGDKGCVDANPTTVKAILDNPEGHYVNLHTKEFPKGAIRGQLSHAAH